MNENRGHYASAPLNNMKNKKAVQAASPAAYGQMEKQEAPVRRSNILTIVMTAVLPVLFLLALLINNPILRLVFLAAAAIGVMAMWVMNVFARSARSTLTVAYIALMVVIVLALVLNMQAPESQKTSVNQNMEELNSRFTKEVSRDALSEFLQSNAAPPTPAVYVIEDTAISSAQKQLETFLTRWSSSDIPGMLALCTSSWVSQQSSPEGELWNLILNRNPVSYQVENVSGSEADTSRTITVKITFVNTGTGETVIMRMHVLMFRVNEVWYVDPQSLNGTVVDEAAELAKAQEGTNRIASTKAPATPTPQPNAQDSIKLYYNPDGGKYYHINPICPDVSEQYWPLTAFYFSDLNTQKFANLMFCPTCGAPPRN